MSRIFRSEWFLFAALGILVVLLWLATPFVVAEFIEDFGQRGVSGDLYGSLNALFTGLAFAGLVTTLIMQKRELTLQREEVAHTREELFGQKEQLENQVGELRRQAFETTFFQMIALLRTTVREMSGGRGAKGAELVGHDYIAYLTERLVHEFRVIIGSFTEELDMEPDVLHEKMQDAKAEIGEEYSC